MDIPIIEQTECRTFGDTWLSRIYSKSTDFLGFLKTGYCQAERREGKKYPPGGVKYIPCCCSGLLSCPCVYGDLHAEDYTLPLFGIYSKDSRAMLGDCVPENTVES